MFKKILIANRGEIAVRVIRACHEMGIAAVAVYSDVDRAALHVRKADEAYPIGAAAASESYLNIQKILDVAARSGADAIHPGYGFLSENAKFTRACADSGVKFIGPTAAAMDAMGSKTRARQAMERAGIPFVPGTSRGLESFEQAEEVAARIGYPVMLKAAAGGGGKGMRLVHAPEDLRSSLEGARSEAERSFGDSEVYIEKAIVNPRHIEMQILADEHGNTTYLGERECSLQRRHQKVVEEAPSPIVDADMRRRMGEVAVRVAQAAGYTNAGTVEFLVDQQKNFYFLEMNTRLQVEHPVTELITGLDLVQLQIRIAAGERLPFTQDEVVLRGHAIECRIYAEDPETSGNGGDLGTVPESGLKGTDPATRDAVMKLKPGQYSPIVAVVNPATRQAVGYRIIKLVSKEPAGQRELSDPRVQQAIRSQLHDRREQLLKAAYYEVLRDSAKVENYYAKKVLDSNGMEK